MKTHIIKKQRSVVRARVDASLKTDTEEILNSVGLTISDAINIFLTQIKLRNGIPFEIKIPNAITRKTFSDTDKKINIIRCENTKDMFEKLEV